MQGTSSYDSDFGQTFTCAPDAVSAAGQRAVDSMQAWKGLVTYLRIDRLLASWNILRLSRDDFSQCQADLLREIVTVVLSNFQNQRLANPMRG